MTAALPPPSSRATVWTSPDPLSARYQQLHQAVESRPGWTMAGALGPVLGGTVIAEYRPVVGGPGGVVVGGDRRWWWSADDGAGTPLGSNVHGLSLDTAWQAVDAVEATAEAARAAGGLPPTPDPGPVPGATP